jgi:hypothetical protein
VKVSANTRRAGMTTAYMYLTTAYMYQRGDVVAQ